MLDHCPGFLNTILHYQSCGHLQWMKSFAFCSKCLKQVWIVVISYTSISRGGLTLLSACPPANAGGSLGAYASDAPSSKCSGLTPAVLLQILIGWTLVCGLCDMPATALSICFLEQSVIASTVAHPTSTHRTYKQCKCYSVVHS